MTFDPTASIATQARSFASGAVGSVAFVEAALDRIAAHRDAGGAAYVGVPDRPAALWAAAAADAARAAGWVPSPLAGLPVSIKDLFDVAGEVTGAGAMAQPPGTAAAATQDAQAVRRLRVAGAIPLGRTNMSEYAFSGLGLNPHHGHPAPPAHPDRVAGGSTSGGAVSVALGAAVAALGSDTGGSLRIPAAFCDLVGFKPTAARSPRTGAFPLSRTLDTVGAISRTVACAAVLDAVLCDGDALDTRARPLDGLRLGVTHDLVLDQLEPGVAQAFEDALQRLSAGGARIVSFPFSGLRQWPALNAQGGLVTAEAWHVHRAALRDPERAARYDPRVAQRTRRGAAISAADYLDLLDARAALQAEARAQLRGIDAWLMPTVALHPPLRAPLVADDPLFFDTNARVLRNTAIVNFLDGCALTLPCTAAGGLPVGLSVCGLAFDDAQVLQVARAVEAALAGPA